MEEESCGVVDDMEYSKKTFETVEALGDSNHQENVQESDKTATNDDFVKVNDDQNDQNENYPILVRSGFKPGEEMFLEKAIQNIMTNALDQEILTNGFVLELFTLLHNSKLNSRISIPPDKISTRDFAAVIGCILYKWSPDKVTREFIKKVAYRRDLESLEAKVASGKLLKEDSWITSRKLKKTVSNDDSNDQIDPNNDPLTIQDKPQEVIISESNDETETAEDSHLLRKGFVLGEDDPSLVEQLELWKPSKEDITNGVVLEIGMMKNSECSNELIQKIFAILGIHPTRQNSRLLRKQFIQYVIRTTKTAFSCSELEDPWIFWQSLEDGGKLFKSELLRSISRFDETINFLKEALANQEIAKWCDSCGAIGDHFGCQGCFSVFYCSPKCQEEAWFGHHNLVCLEFSKKLLKDGAKLPPKDLGEDRKLLGKYRNSLRLVSLMDEKNVELMEELQSSKNHIDELREENMTSSETINQLEAQNEHLKDALVKVRKEKAGKSSAFARMKRKYDEMEDESEDEEESTVALKTTKTQTLVSLGQNSDLVEMKPDVSVQLKGLNIFSGKELRVEERNYGESTFVRIPSSRQTVWPNDKVSTRTVKNRAEAAKDFITLISGTSDLSEENSAPVEKLLFAELVKQNKDVFKDLLRSDKDTLACVMKLTPEETSKMMHGSNCSYSSKRRIATMFGKFLNFNPLASESKQREVEKTRQTLVERDTLEHGTLLLHKTAHSEYATLCAFVRTTDLASFISDLVVLARSQEVSDLASMKNLDHPLYFNKLWVVIGGDKGAATMKFTAAVGGHDAHLFGMFQASDLPANLLAFQSNYVDQIKRMIAFGVKVTFEDEASRVFEVEVISKGDKAYLSDQNGHAGGAATYPSIYRLVTSTHLRKSHLDGSSHSRENPACQFPERTPASIEEDFHENIVDNRSGTVRTRGKHHHSIVGPRLLPLISQLHNSISSLHIGLAVVLSMVNFIEVDCDIIDGSMTNSDANAAKTRFSEFEGEDDDKDDEDEEPGLHDEDDQVGLLDGADQDGLLDQPGDDEQDEMLTAVMRHNKVEREMLEIEWQAKSIEVLEAEAKHRETSEEISDKLSVLRRVEAIEAGDHQSVVKMAKKLSKARYSLKTFRKWKPMESWRCDDCLLTGYDRDILWKVCKTCHKNTHIYCQAFSTDEEENMSEDTFRCRPCSGIVSLTQIKENLLTQVSELKNKSSSITVFLSSLKQEESSLKSKCKLFMGATRMKLQDILESKLSVNRSDYHSSCFVGNHCDVIVERFEEVTEVLASEPETKKKYDEFFQQYKPLHFLMKAKRFLTPEELDTIDICCAKIGEVYPKYFKTSITPKLDDLIFVVPQFSRKWNTVGGLREEDIEAFHNTSK